MSIRWALVCIRWELGEYCSEKQSAFFAWVSGGKTFPAFPAHAQPAILRIWQEAHWHEWGTIPHGERPSHTFRQCFVYLAWYLCLCRYYLIITAVLYCTILYCTVLALLECRGTVWLLVSQQISRHYITLNTGIKEYETMSHRKIELVGSPWIHSNYYRASLCSSVHRDLRPLW